MLGDHGFNGLTIQALAERCGISNAGLLYYFKSKDELLLAVLDEFELRESEVIGPRIAQLTGSVKGPAKALSDFTGLVHEMVARFAQRPELARLLFVLQTEALDRTHVANDWFRKRDELTLGLFQTLLDRFACDGTTIARQLLASMHGLGQHWLRQDMSFDLLAEWRLLSGLIISQIELEER